jgi:GAF domain-containing protein
MTGFTGPRPESSAVPDLVEAFSALQLLLVSTQDVDSFLEELAKLAADAVSPSASCGITVQRGGQPMTVASSGALAQQVDELQYDVGAGPCLETLATGAVIDVPELIGESRWGDYPAHALGQGVRSSLSTPLMVDGASVGALNLYGSHPHAFDGAARQQAETFATQAATALTLVLRNANRAAKSAQLEQALSSRTVIDQALGILMAQQRCAADEAFALLRRHSQNNNRKLRDVAADIITQVSGRPPLPAHGFDG